MKILRKMVAVVLGMSLMLQQTGFAQVAPQMNIPAYLNGYVAQDRFRPIQLRSITLEQDAADLNLHLDCGDARKVSSKQVKDSAQQLLAYFQIGLSLPNSTFWVNLRPDAEDRIMDARLEKTDLGKVFIAADLQLKKDLAAFTSPDTKEGHEYWSKLYAKAEQIFGTQDITIPTVTRPWIVPGEIILRQSQGSAYIYKATLKVMLEQDQFSEGDESLGISVSNESNAGLKEINDYSSQLIRELVLPKLTAQINSSRKYASLRQAYYSIILAQWYKRQFKGQQGLYTDRIDSANLAGLESKKSWSKTTYFNAYKKSFSRGEYNKEEVVSGSQGMTVRQYVSGGLTIANTAAAFDGGSKFIGNNQGLNDSLIGYSALTNNIQLPMAAVNDGGIRNNDDAAGKNTSKLSNVRAYLTSDHVLSINTLMSFHMAMLTGIVVMFSTIIYGISTGHIPSVSELLLQDLLAFEIIGAGVITLLSRHITIAVHEMGHYLMGKKLQALRTVGETPEQDAQINSSTSNKLKWYFDMFMKIPFGKFPGVIQLKGLGRFDPSYYVDLKTPNLGVSAAGPAMSKKLSRFTLLPGAVMMVGGILGATVLGVPMIGYGLIMLGRLLFAVGVVSWLDVNRTDEGAYGKYVAREAESAEKRKQAEQQMAAETTAEKIAEEGTEVKRKNILINNRMKTVIKNGVTLSAPWQFRNTLQGGQHVEGRGNISFQEFMLVVNTRLLEDAAEINNKIQNKCEEMLRGNDMTLEWGLAYVGNGMEGGLIGTYRDHEEQVLQVLTQAIIDCGYVPGKDVFIALDPAASELSNAYNEARNIDFENDPEKKVLGQYRFWMSEKQQEMSNDELIDMYVDWFKKYPIISIEDGLAEDDDAGWLKLMQRLGGDILVIGDDKVTTNEDIITDNIKRGLVNAILIKPNQIGTLTETLRAMDASVNGGCEVVVSHRSKSGVDSIEADLALAYNAVGQKTGGARNSERVDKYGRSVEEMRLFEIFDEIEDKLKKPDPNETIILMEASEVQTNAGPPTVKVKIMLSNGVEFFGITPVGSSAGVTEAFHRTDGDKNRYGGKGQLQVVADFNRLIAPRFIGRKLSELGDLMDIDRELLMMEKEQALLKGKELPGLTGHKALKAGVLYADSSKEEIIRALQRKTNLGMNAILPASFALARTIAFREGMRPWQLFRSMANQTDKDYLYGFTDTPSVIQPPSPLQNGETAMAFADGGKIGNRLAYRHQVIREEETKLLQEIRDAVTDADDSRLKKLRQETVNFHQNVMVYNFAVGSVNWIVPPPAKAFDMIDSMERQKAEGVLTGFDIMIDFETARNGIKNDVYVPYIFLMGGLTYMMVLIPTPSGLKELVNDTGYMKGMGQKIANGPIGEAVTAHYSEQDGGSRAETFLTVEEYAQKARELYNSDQFDSLLTLAKEMQKQFARNKEAFNLAAMFRATAEYELGLQADGGRLMLQEARLLSQIEDAVNNNDDGALDQLHKQLVDVQKKMIWSRDSNWVRVKNEDIAEVTDDLKKEELNGVWTGFGVSRNFEDAVQGVNDGEWEAYVVVMGLYGSTMVLLPTITGLKNFVHDTGTMKGMDFRRSSADGGLEKYGLDDDYQPPNMGSIIEERRKKEREEKIANDYYLELYSRDGGKGMPGDPGIISEVPTEVAYTIGKGMVVQSSIEDILKTGSQEEINEWMELGKFMASQEYMRSASELFSRDDYAGMLALAAEMGGEFPELAETIRAKALFEMGTEENTRTVSETENNNRAERAGDYLGSRSQNGKDAISSSGLDAFDGGVPVGGVDMRALPLSLQPIDPGTVIADPRLLKMSLDDLDKTWTDLRGAVEQQAVPYQQLKEYVAACKSRPDASAQMAKVQRYIGELLKLEEERAVSTAPEMREIVGIIG